LTAVDEHDAPGIAGGAMTGLSGEYACKTCHNGTDHFSLSFPSGLTIHN